MNRGRGFARSTLVALLILSSNLFICPVNLVECFNDFLESYQTLSYRPISGVERSRRSIYDSNNNSLSVMHLRFQAYDRVFHLVLRLRSSGLFADNHVLEINGQEEQIESHQGFYDGFLVDDSGSTVHGSVIDGVFDGYIETGEGKLYTVEKTSRYFAADNRPSQYHSIIYADANIFASKFGNEDLVDNLFRQENSTNRLPTYTSSHLACGVTESTNQKAHSSALSVEPQSKQKRNENISQRMEQGLAASRTINGRQIYEVRSCSVHIQVDHTLYQMVYEREGNYDVGRTYQEIMSLVGNHIGEVNRIFKNTDFGGIKGINFVVQRTKIYDVDSCVGPRSNPFCVENVDVSNYLNILSSQDHKDFCLAYALTYRDFTGILGLAWVAKADPNTPGGVCEPHHRTGTIESGRSLNTGVVTLVNYGRRVPLRTSALTLAHEIGHSFGAPHDEQSQCLLGGEKGYFIMFPKANDGYRSNNEKFSECSKDSITSVLFSVLQEDPDSPQPGRKRNCFHQGDDAFCGNQIVERGEQCDCGFDKSDCDAFPDQCCQPGECKLKPGKRCSPSEGTCCGDDCNPLSGGTACGLPTECRIERTCDGSYAKCPDGIPKLDGTLCLSSTKVCCSGECIGSVCAELGLRDCFLTNGNPEELCHLACEKNGVCTSTFELEEFKNEKFKQDHGKDQFGLRILPGQPCKNFSGFCDIMYKCRGVDSDGPLSRLKSMLFGVHISAVTNWMEKNWWACIPFATFFVSSMCLCIKYCAVDTPSSKPVSKKSHTVRHTRVVPEARRLRNESLSEVRVTSRSRGCKSVRFAVGQVRLSASSSSG